MTHQQFQNLARQRLIAAGHAPEDAHATARLLLDWATEKRYAALTEPDAMIDQITRIKLEDALQKLEARVPFPHISGCTHFYGMEWRVAPTTLIPRPETEFLVEAVLQRLPPGARVADLGTGSGAIAVSLVKARPDLQMWATEISSDALAIARSNAAWHGAEIHFLQGAPDWLSPLKNLPRFDALVSNPPYIPAAHIETLQPEVRIYEPRGALDGGDDGLDSYRIFAARGRDFLSKDGFCAVELGEAQWDAARQLFEASGWRVEAAVCDLQNIRRVLVAHHA